ncbi:MAG: DUF3060 domain-containing protein [Acidisphaera sp.]|nr:DUF3060 domain-containing protein [Acidisphaera sp.]
MRFVVMRFPGGAVLACWAFLLAAAARAQTADVRGDGLDQVVACDGGAASLQGNGNTIAFRGACRSLDLRGEGDRVQIDIVSGGSIHLEGNGDRVRYRVVNGGESPRVLVRGEGSTVVATAAPEEPAYSERSVAPLVNPEPRLPRLATRTLPPPRPAPPTPPSAVAKPAPTAEPSPPPRPVPAVVPATGPIVLGGDGQTRDLDCTGRDVQIEGNGGVFTLRGGCHSLAIQGNGEQVKAELLPGVPLTVQGEDDVVTYTVHGAGADPNVWVNGHGSTARKAARPG